MAKAHRCTNHANPEQLAARSRTPRPTLTTPDGAQGWYQVTNGLDEGGSPVASISIYGDVGSWGISAAAFMDELKAVDAPEINLNINSPGGEVFDGLAIHNALRSHRARVMVQVDALAASIASVIAMAGDRVIMSPHSQMMIHDAATVAQGNPEELREMADFLDRQSDNIAAIYAERAGGTVKQWRARMKAESWFFADEAVEAGLADEVAKFDRPGEDDVETARATAAAWDLSVYNYAHTSREQAPAPDVTPPPAAPAPVAAVPSQPVFDPAAFRAATVAALDLMPDYQPDHMRSLMAGVAGDAPAAPAARVEAAAYTPPLAAAVAPAAQPQEVAVDYFRSLFTGVANNAPAAPTPAAAQQEPQERVVYVPEPPPPAGQVVAEYLRSVMTGVANDAPAPDQAPGHEPTAPEPIPAVDRTAFDRALWEARL